MTVSVYIDIGTLSTNEISGGSGNVGVVQIINNWFNDAGVAMKNGQPYYQPFATNPPPTSGTASNPVWTITQMSFGMVSCGPNNAPSAACTRTYTPQGSDYIDFATTTFASNTTASTVDFRMSHETSHTFWLGDCHGYPFPGLPQNAVVDPGCNGTTTSETPTAGASVYQDGVLIATVPPWPTTNPTLLDGPTFCDVNAISKYANYNAGAFLDSGVGFQPAPDMCECLGAGTSSSPPTYPTCGSGSGVGVSYNCGDSTSPVYSPGSQQGQPGPPPTSCSTGPPYVAPLGFVVQPYGPVSGDCDASSPACSSTADGYPGFCYPQATCGFSFGAALPSCPVPGESTNCVIYENEGDETYDGLIPTCGLDIAGQTVPAMYVISGADVGEWVCLNGIYDCTGNTTSCDEELGLSICDSSTGQFECDPWYNYGGSPPGGGGGGGCGGGGCGGCGCGCPYGYAPDGGCECGCGGCGGGGSTLVRGAGVGACTGSDCCDPYACGSCDPSCDCIETSALGPGVPLRTRGAGSAYFAFLVTPFLFGRRRRNPGRNP